VPGAGIRRVEGGHQLDVENNVFVPRMDAKGVNCEGEKGLRAGRKPANLMGNY